jgi:acetyl esterase
LAFFGGAFRQGGVDHPSVDIFNRTRAHDAGIIVAAVDYALAPEHTYPEALEQGYAALEWLGGGADGIGLRVDRLGIEGQSSGANLAAGVALMSRDRGGPALAFQLLEVPTLDLTGGHLSRADAWKIGAPPFLVARGLRALVRDYLGDSSLATQPYASPLLAPDLSGLPPAHIAIAEYDLLRGDGEAYAARLAAAGIEVKLEQFARLGHESLLYTAALEPARRWQADVTELLRTLRSDT